MDSSSNGFRSRPFNSAQRFQSPNIPVRNADEVESLLEKLQNDTGYKVERELGLRRLLAIPDGNVEDQPASHQRGREIFIGRLPKDLLEDELLEFCSRIVPPGTIREIRLMLQPDGLSNRGYAFVVFSSFELAQDAIAKLDNTEIRNGYRVGVKRSVDNCRLFMGNIPRDKTKEEFEAEIRKQPSCGENVLKVIMYQDVLDKNKNRGFAFVEFPSHRQAAIVRRELMKEKFTIWGKEICVDWAQPEAEVDKTVMDQVRVLYIRNLSAETTEAKLLEVCHGLVDEGSIEKVKKLRDFAFVHFHNREDAQRALELLNGTVIDGSAVEVMWAKPSDSRNPPNQQFRNPHQNVFPWSNANMCLQYFGYHPEFDMSAQYRHVFNMNAAALFRGQPPPRHYRNAAGTRTRFARQNGYPQQEMFDGTGNYNLNSGYYIDGSHDGYHSSGYVTPEHMASYPQIYPQGLNLHSIPSPIHSQSPVPANYQQLRNSHEILPPFIYHQQNIMNIPNHHYGHPIEAPSQQHEFIHTANGIHTVSQE